MAKIHLQPWLKKHLTAALKAAVTLALLALALRTVRFDELAASFRGASPRPLAAAALLLALGGFAGAASWFCPLRLRLPSLRFRDAAACHWIGMFFNCFLPSNIGGDAVKGVMIGSQVKDSADGPNNSRTSSSAFIIATLLTDRAVNFSMLLGIGATVWLSQRCGPACAVLAAALCTAALAAVLAVARRRWAPGRQAFVLPFLLAAFASQFLKTWSNAFIISALGLELPPLAMWYVIPVFGVVSALPISIGGLGVRELAAQTLAGPLHADGTALVALSLAGHLLTVAVSLLGALPLLFRPAAPPTDPRASAGS
ncbi:MAG: flippase-like domain-containing protein [Verrucomicrobiota bacterium]|nr:flippase-like domain-containing protein [Verrucomicrobiota bacterium]